MASNVDISDVASKPLSNPKVNLLETLSNVRTLSTTTARRMPEGSLCSGSRLRSFNFVINGTLEHDISVVIAISVMIRFIAIVIVLSFSKIIIRECLHLIYCCFTAIIIV